MEGGGIRNITEGEGEGFPEVEIKFKFQGLKMGNHNRHIHSSITPKSCNPLSKTAYRVFV